MKRKRIKRRVVGVDTSNQIGLFVPGKPSEIAPSSPSAAAAKLPMRFHEPDPKRIRVNEVPLQELLRQAGQQAPLKIRALLGELSFAEFEHAYEPGGRPPYAPRAMVGVILGGILQGITSLRELERFARLDLGCWWVSGGIMPDHSILGRFIQRHEAVLTESFFEQLTRQVLKVTHSGSAVLAGDGTVIEAAASRYRLVRAEALQAALQAARTAAQNSPEEPAQVKQVRELEQAAAILQQRQQVREARGKDPSSTRINPQEPDAVVQLQKDKQRFEASYKPSVLANEARVIVACEVHPSSETEVMPMLLDRAQAQGHIDTLLLDAGYFSETTLTATATREIELLCPQGSTQGENWDKQSSKFYPKSRFIYEAQHDCYRCPNGAQLTPLTRRRAGKANPLGYVHYATSACAQCALAKQCTRSPHGRLIKRYAIDRTKDALRAKMTDPTVRARYRQRQAMVEPVFGHVRHHQGLNRFRRTGLPGVRVEFALHAMAYNLSRAVARAIWIIGSIGAVLGAFKRAHKHFLLHLVTQIATFQRISAAPRRMMSVC
jgi:transposase